MHDLNEEARARGGALAAARPDDGTGDDPADAVADAPRWPLPASSEEGREYLSDLLARARKGYASDLLLVAGSPPTLRRHGRLEALGESPLSAGMAGLLCGALVPARRRDTAESLGAVDFTTAPDGLGRFRCNVHRQRDQWSAAVRLLCDEIPTLEQLNLPPEHQRYADLEYGLVLVTGPTGSVKSTTLASLIRRILSRRRVHLITVEDPVEYEHAHGDSVVEHIEVGRDVPDFPSALRSALRQDPDVLLVGEMRDLESVSMAIAAAETGHLVLSTLHTGDSAQTVHRIVDAYPAAQQEQVRTQLSASLAGVVSQQLLPRAEGEGRVPAVENLVATPAVRNLIRLGKMQMVRSQITLEMREGMLSLDHSLARLAREGIVEIDEARRRARAPSDFEQALRA